MDTKKVKDTIMQLSKMCDLIALRVQITDKSNYGKRPHPTDNWGYTRAFLAYYAEGTDSAAVIGLFEAAGVHSDTEAARWLLRHDKLVP